MVPIYLDPNGNERGFLKDFERDFLRICQQHRSANRAIAFAFILYDINHPQIRHVLADNYYWQCLDELSGKQLTVFSFRYAETTTPRRFTRSMHDVGELTSSDKARTFFSDYFDVEIRDSKPLIFFFQVVDERIVDSYVVKVKSETIEQSFNEIKSIFSEALDSIKNVEPEFRNNSNEIFMLIRNRLSQRQIILATQAAAKAIKSIYDVAQGIKSFIG